jgi:hypothetical protein
MAEEIKAQVPESVQMLKATARVTVPAEDVPKWEKNGFVVIKDEAKKI